MSESRQDHYRRGSGHPDGTSTGTGQGTWEDGAISIVCDDAFLHKLLQDMEMQIDPLHTYNTTKPLKTILSIMNKFGISTHNQNSNTYITLAYLYILYYIIYIILYYIYILEITYNIGER